MVCLTKCSTEACRRLYFMGPSHAAQTNGTKSLQTSRTNIIHWFLRKWHRHQWKDTVKFTRLHIPVRLQLVYFQVHTTLLLSSFPPPHFSIKPSLSEGIRNTQLILSSLNNKSIVIIILVNIGTEEKTSVN